MPTFHAFIDLSRRKPYICGICRLDITHPCHQPTLIQATYQAPDREEQLELEPEPEPQPNQLSLF